MAGVPQLDDRVTRVVFEALETVASPEVAADIVANALTDVDLDGAPASPELLRRFVTGQLWPAVVARLGVEAADSVADLLIQVADSWELADSHVRGKRRGARPTEGYADELAAQGGRPAAAVLVLTSDPGLTADLQAAVGQRATASVVADSLDLLRQLEDVAGRRSVLVVDCLTSPIPLATLITSAPYLPEDTPVLLWRSHQPVDLSEVPRSCVMRWSVLRPGEVSELAATLGHVIGD